MNSSQIEETYTQKRYAIHKVLLGFVYASMIAYLIWSVIYAHIITLQAGLATFVIFTVIFGISLIIMLPEINAVMNDMEWNEITWGKGSKTEKMVFEQLQSLPIKKYVVEDLNIKGNGNIDMVLVSEKCIMAIEVNSKKGILRLKGNDFYVNDNLRNSDIHQAESEFKALREMLNYRFNGKYLPIQLLEYPNAESDGSVSHRIHDVNIGGRKYHEYLIKKSQLNLTDWELKSIYDYLLEVKAAHNETKTEIVFDMVKALLKELRKDPLFLLKEKYDRNLN